MTIAYGWAVWVCFSLFLIIALSIDTFVVNKKHIGPDQSIRAALIWTSIWVACALIFNFLLWVYVSRHVNLAIANEVALNFFTGYLIEKSLSLDNLFAFYLIFHQFHIPTAYQRRVFSYGIWSAIVLRLLLILTGSWLIQHFHSALYIMGAFLLLTGIKMCFTDEEEKELATSPLFVFLKRFLRLTHEFNKEKFFIKKGTLLYATPLMVALVFIELTDLVFAFDSIPAIFAITTDPFIVWTSNIFAILGLRAMYFLLVGMVKQFYLLKYAIALILVFVGSKMLIAPWIKIPTQWSLLVIVSLLVVFSLVGFLSRKIK